MSLTATFGNRFTAVFTPPKFTTQESGLPLLTELDAAIQTESSVDIVIDRLAGGNIHTFETRGIGLNVYHVIAPTKLSVQPAGMSILDETSVSVSDEAGADIFDEAVVSL